MNLFNRVILIIPIKGGDYPVTEDDIAEFQRAYPRLDVTEQCHQARLWCIANPRKRKTKRGIMRFLNSWMSRANQMPQTISDDEFDRQVENIKNG